MKNKNGWMRLMEAVIAVLILSSVMIVLYINNSPRVSYSNQIFDVQTKILDGIALNENIRNKTIFGNKSLAPKELQDYVNQSLTDNFEFYIIVCDLNDLVCSYSAPTDREVFVEDRIIGGNVYNSTSKLVRLYVWER